jgi:hypothetical protein
VFYTNVQGVVGEVVTSISSNLTTGNFRQHRVAVAWLQSRLARPAALRLTRQQMPIPADIMFSIDWEAGEVTFSASTRQAERWMGCTEKTVPLADAKTFRETAEAEGLTVAAFP